jgi:prophage maintenance system killer protein
MSIEFINPDRQQVEDRSNELSESETDILSYSLDEDIHVLYAGSKPPESAEEVEMDPNALAAEVEGPTRAILLRSLQAFVSVIERKEVQENERLRAYKQLEPGAIARAIDRVDWDGSVVEVGGQLMSNLILRHPFPNANHRTSLIMLERYVRADQRTFDLPKMHTTDYEWKEWADEYIRDSKRILTVRRNAPRFFHLDRFGCETIVRKGEIEIELDRWDLTRDVNEAHEQYAVRHEKLCEEFAEQILRRQPDAEPVREGLGKRDFAEYLSELD